MGRVSTVLNHAAEEIEKRGKSRHHMINSRGNVCALGALRLAAGAIVGDDNGDVAIFSARMNWEIYDEAYRALDGYLLEKKFYKNYTQKDDGVAGWNDRNNAETVVKVIRDAAKHADYVDALTMVRLNEEVNAL